MALTAAQRRALSRRTTASSRARLRARFAGQPMQRAGMQQAYTPNAGMVPTRPSIRPVTPGIAPGANATPQAPTVARSTAQFVPDAQYLAQAAQAQFERQTKLDQIKAEHEAAVASYNEGQRRLMEGVPDQRQQLKEGANKAGLFYSGRLGKQLGDLETQIARQRADATNQFRSEDAAREAARTAILQGAPVEEAAARAEAVQRQIERDQQSAANNRLVATPRPKPRTRPKPKRRRRKR